MLEIHNIYKSYGKINALCGLSFNVGDGVYGLLGPNGSGKTTLMNILTNNIKLDSGIILFNGEKFCADNRSFRSIIGYMPQYCEMIPEFTCVEFLNYMAILKELELKSAEKQIKTLLERFELDDVMYRKISSFSGGMKQRLMLIQAFLGDPKLILLDEPTAGLDPKQRILVKNFISEQSLGKTIIIATHIIADIERIAKEIICLKKGEAIFCGDTNSLKSIADGIVWSYDGINNEIEEIKTRFHVVSINGEDEKVQFRILSKDKPFENAVELIPSLEDAYMMLYGDGR